LDGFDLNYYTVVYDQVDSIAGVDQLAVVYQGQDDLRANCQATFSQFVRDTQLVCGFEQSRAYFGVHPVSCIDDRTGHSVNLFRNG
jgi:hypothetical protein